MENDGSSERPAAAEARQALDALDSDGARLARHLVTPWRYHVLLGLAVGAFGLSQALRGPESLILIAVGLAAIPVLVATSRRRQGVTVAAPAGPRGRRVLVGFIVVTVLVLGAGLAVKILDVSPWWGLVPATVGFVMTVISGRRYDAVLREEIAQASGDRP